MRSHSSAGKCVDVDAMRQRIDAGIVDEDVETAIARHGRLDRGVHRRLVADVDRAGDGSRQSRRDRLGACEG